VAETIVRTEGSDKILKALQESNTRLNQEKLDLYRRAVDHASPSH